MKMFAVLWTAVLLATVSCVAPAEHPRVQVEGGTLEGRLEDGLAVYRGVPYAAPPVVSLRWRAPQQAAPWQGVREVAAFAPACPQTGVSMPGETPHATSEDCLYLNIWAPSKTDSRVPVLVWIHGGGYANGSAAMPLYWGDRLARHDLVVVTLGYRLGPLGFLAHPGLSAENPEHASGNYGLMDQVAALRWVQRNIAAFGGDPDRVTIAGQSAGASAISLLMASPTARGLFDGVIAQSGGVFEPLQIAPAYALANAEQEGAAYATKLGAGTVAELRALPVKALLRERPASGWHPVVEPGFLPRLPYDVFEAGEQADVPLLVGYNAEEARALVDLGEVTTNDFEDGITRAWGPLPPPLLAAYPHATDDEARRARADFERDLRFGWDAWTWARLHARTASRRVYAYYFTQRPPFPSGSPYEGWGASHFAELWYMFDHLDQSSWAWRKEDRQLASAMAQYWANFVHRGDPNGGGLAQWPRFADPDGQVIRLGTPISVGEAPNLDTQRVFDEVYRQIRGGTD